MKKKKREQLEKALQQLTKCTTLICYNPATGDYVPYFLLNDEQKAQFDAMDTAIRIIEKKLRKKK